MAYVTKYGFAYLMKLIQIVEESQDARMFALFKHQCLRTQVSPKDKKEVDAKGYKGLVDLLTLLKLPTKHILESRTMQYIGKLLTQSPIFVDYEILMEGYNGTRKHLYDFIIERSQDAHKSDLKITIELVPKYTKGKDAGYAENEQQHISDAIDLLPRFNTGIDVNIKFRRSIRFFYILA
ncbi:MINDY deubiquitinase domain-containing protein [Forsythia ovata]|uniref:MINDY deubiquitinase domain-containing protein n=1 Tax=Forsythia ovata TaxID=205694 RepID=A0ABD1SMB0_9LAMI